MSVVIGLVLAAIAFGALLQIVKHPTNANGLLGASTDFITGLYKAESGQG